jgi:general secretion pathway protein N
MRTRSIVLLGAAAYIAFLVATVPARFVAARILDATRGAVQLLDPAGTLWSGDARAVVATPSGTIAVDRIQWRFLPSRLAALRIAFDAKATLSGLDAALEIGRGPSTWDVRDLRAVGDVAALSALSPLVAAWRPEGRFSLAAPSFSWNDSRANGDARLEWTGAALALSEVRPLGHYLAVVHAESGPARVVVTTLDGPLRVAGQGSIAPAGRFEFSGDARAEGANAAALDPLLNLIGPRRADGSRALGWRLN